MAMGRIDNPKIRDKPKTAAAPKASTPSNPVKGAAQAVKDNPALKGAGAAIKANPALKQKAANQMGKRGGGAPSRPRAAGGGGGGGGYMSQTGEPQEGVPKDFNMYDAEQKPDEGQMFDEGSLDAGKADYVPDPNADKPEAGTPSQGRMGAGGQHAGLFPNSQMQTIVHLIHQASADGSLSDEERADIEAARSLLMTRAQARQGNFRNQVGGMTSQLQDRLQRRLRGPRG